MFNTGIFDNSGTSDSNEGFLNAPQPIDIAYQRQASIFNNLRFRRESIAHSQGMGGVSWGSVTIGLWLKDEVMMYGQSHNHNSNSNSHLNNHQGGNSGHQSNLINPRHGLLRYGGGSGSVFGAGGANQGGLAAGGGSGHNFSMLPPNTTSYLPNLEANYCKDYSCCGQLLPTLHDLLRHYEEAHISTSPPAHETSSHMLDAHRTRNNLNNIHNVMETVSTNDVFLNNHAHQQQPIGGTLHLPPAHFNIQQQTISQGSMTQTILPSLTLAGGVHGGEVEGSALHGMNRNVAPGVGVGAGGAGNVNRLQVVNRSKDSGMGASGHNSSGIGAGGAGIGGGAGGPGVAGNDLDRMYIDDPARHLYVMENEEYKPFKCPVIGCEKTYKNQNGLKYHRLHGHQNQTLKENEDGTFSIIDPESNTPYLDGTGMEKDKPYRCEVCGKRYKNLNGLKYHRGHTTH